MNYIIIEGLAFALPLFIIAIGGIYSERSGVTNLALEGFQGFGSFVGAATVIAMTGGDLAGREVEMFFFGHAVFRFGRSAFCHDTRGFVRTL